MLILGLYYAKTKYYLNKCWKQHAPNLFVGNYSERIKENIKRIKKLPKIKGVKEILYPGQSKQRRYKKNLNKKINIPSNVAEDLKKLN